MPAIGEKPVGAAIVPIVKDMLHHVQIASGWNGFEEVSTNELATPGDVTVQLRPSGRHNMIQIKEDAMCIPITPQYRREQRALASADVDHSPCRREIVAGDYRLRRRGCIFGIHRSRQPRSVRMLP